ncbi:MAG: ABC-2 transporter permease [Niameybacter sp.]|uniref:ABC-2 transporter permease n=1 Tax=Niameybacter sp. TaxID=2033640 RepID=UPI002FC5A0C2
MSNVGLLMRKELIYLFKCLKSTWIISLLFMTVFTLIAPQMCMLATIIVPYFLIYGVMAHEEQSHSNALNHTLPVSRKEVGMSKYLLGLVYSLVVGIGVTLVLRTGLVMEKEYIKVFEQMGWINLSSILIGSALFYTALIIPIILRFGCMKMRMVMFVIYGVLFGVSSVVINIIKEVIVNPFETPEVFAQIQIPSSIGIVFLIGIFICYGLSYGISSNILEKKQINA